ncbi:Solute carrier family 25 member 45 [Lamellibrachia satsuma]|nr:Solute carrier family 25 member 45 [Lamellibrachia satsuma]
MKHFAGPRACAGWIYRHNGVVGFYRGLRTMVIRDIPTFGLYVVIYEYLSDILPRGVVTTMAVGGFAGVASWAACFPFDVIKSRLQADVIKCRYTGLLNCTVKMYHEGGVKIFYTGLGVTCLRAFPVNAVTMLFYSTSLKFLETLEASPL